MRKQIEERAYFTYEQKEQILAKSDSKCCHCGRKLTLTDKNYKKITVEHIIPISKGGTNEDKNLVALCEECNKAKGNQVIMPEDYLLYLNKEHLEVAKAMYADYCADVSWFSTHCYTREDAYPIDYQMPMPNLGGKTPKAKEKCGYYVSGMSHRAILKRCTADDLDALCDYVYKYNRKFNVTATLTPEQVREVVTDEFNRGCIYKLHKNGEIMALFPMAIERHKYIFEDNSEHMIYVIGLHGLPVLYQKEYYEEPVTYALGYIMDSLSYLNEYRAIQISAHVPNNDAFANRILEHLAHDYPDIDGDDTTWNHYTVCCHMDEIRSGSLSNGEKVALAISRGIERNMRLKTAEQFQKAEKYKDAFFKTNENQKKAHKNLRKMARREEIDEYDPKYYGFA